MSRIYGAPMGILLFSLSGCGTSFVNTGYTCLHPDEEHIGPDGTPDPCHFQDCPACATASPYADLHVCLLSCPEPLLPGVGGNADECAGKCIPGVKGPFKDSALLWLGLPGQQAPECPEEARIAEDERYADPIVPEECTCDCLKPTGSCSLSSTLTASTALCQQGGTSISFDAPVPWSGACSANKSIPASADVKSLRIAPLTMTEGDCQPDPSGTSKSKPRPVEWQKVAHICHGVANIPCEKNGGFCLPDPAPSSGFLKCVYAGGIKDCPAEYPKRHLVVTKTAQPIDMRVCSACTCGKPVGSQCRAQVSVYENNVCAGNPIVSITATSDKDSCNEPAVAAPALLSKVAEPPSYIPGTCSGTSEATGTVSWKDEDVMTFCCLHEEPPG
jgi:hypothetical protein